MVSYSQLRQKQPAPLAPLTPEATSSRAKAKAKAKDQEPPGARHVVATAVLNSPLCLNSTQLCVNLIYQPLVITGPLKNNKQGKGALEEPTCRCFQCLRPKGSYLPSIVSPRTRPPRLRMARVATRPPATPPRPAGHPANRGDGRRLGNFAHPALG